MIRLLRLLVVGLATLLLSATATVQRAKAEERVDLLLVLAVDISRSVDERKFRLQREGYAVALTDQRVINAMTSAAEGRIAICFVEWSGAMAQAVLVDWTVVASATDAEGLAERIRTAPRLFMERTAIGAAIDFSIAQLLRAPFLAARRVIDVSGDGTNNIGRDVALARDAAVEMGVTVNGLAILSETPLPFNPQHTHPPGGLLKYYEDNVIGGEGAFAISAQSHDDFGKAIRQKLIKEIAMAPGNAGDIAQP